MTALDPHRLDPAHLPTPFTADEIRAACRPGRELRLRVERFGQDPVVHVARYVDGDEERAVQESWDETLGGERLGEPETTSETWLELQAHASFPAVATEVGEETIDIPAGRFACRRYIETVEDGRRSFWFATDLPGQPVRWEIRSGDRLVLSVVLVENTPAPGPGSPSG